MADTKPKPNPSDTKPTNTTKPTTSKPSTPRYVSSGQMLASPPLTARLTTLVDNAYNFLGLYFVSLFSLDPFAAAQGSRFNTRGSSGGAVRAGAGGAGVGGVRGGGSGGTGGGPASGRRLGTVDDVRGPECRSCG